jgi:hypothetical protein
MGNREQGLVNVKSYSDSVKTIVEQIYGEEKTGNKKPQESLIKIVIGKVDNWLIKKADEQGIDIHGYVHEISNYFFVGHKNSRHGWGLNHQYSREIDQTVVTSVLRAGMGFPHNQNIAPNIRLVNGSHYIPPKNRRSLSAPPVN